MPPSLTLSLDESGGRPWPLPWGKNRDTFYVLAGVVLDGEQAVSAAEGIRSVIDRNFTPTKRPKELHYGDLINQRKGTPYENMPQPDRQRLSNEVFDLIIAIRPILMGTVIDKVRHRRGQESRGNVALAPQTYAMRATLGRFDVHLTELGKDGFVEMDSAGFQHDSELTRVIASIRLMGTRFGTKSKPTWIDSKLERIRDVRFVRSHDCPGVQLADFVAYATWSHFERRKSRRYKQITSLWRRHGGFTEPSVLPKYT